MVLIAGDNPIDGLHIGVASTLFCGECARFIAAENFPSPLVGEGLGGGYTAAMSTRRARALRQNRTDAEKRLWERLRRKRIDGFRFRQQAPIGRYVADFVCFEAKLVVELDGGQHAAQAARDADRTEWLDSQGFAVLRFWNNEVFENIEGVENVIRTALHAGSATHPLPDPPHQGGGNEIGTAVEEFFSTIAEEFIAERRADAANCSRRPPDGTRNAAEL